MHSGLSERAANKPVPSASGRLTPAVSPEPDVPPGRASSRPLPWCRSSEAGPSLQLQSSQPLIRDDVPSARLFDKLRWQIRRPRRRPALSPRLVKGLLVTHLAQPVADHLLVVALLRLSGRVLARRPEPELRSEEHTSELQSRSDLVCRLLL